MPDYGRQATDAEYKRLRRRVVKVYQQAYKDIAKKAEDFMKKHEAKEQTLRQQLAEGKITQADFDAWMRGQVFQGQQWEAKKRQMADTLYKADTTAQQMVNESRYEVFAQNANYIGYSLEHDAGLNSGFNLYNSQSVARLVREQPDLLPPKKNVGKDQSYKWYNGKINQCVTQGIIQGESLRQMADRIGKTTGETSATAMLRNARTMHTGAENAGRLEGMHQAQSKGIKLKKQWMATLDSHTRDTHADLDGQIVDIDQPFEVDGMEINYPGDASCGWPELVWNCRCTMVEIDPEFPDDMTQRRAWDDEKGEWELIENMSYREWEHWKATGEMPERDEAEPEPEPIMEDNSDIISEMREHRIFDGIDYETRDVILQDIEHGDRQSAERALQCMDNAEVNWHASKSCYLGDGVINMADKDSDEVGRVFWHEYGHFIDDADASGSGITMEKIYVTSQGVEKHEIVTGASWMAKDDGKFNEAVDKDLNAFFARHNLDFESKGGGAIYRSDGSYIDPRRELFGEDAERIQNALNDDWKRLTGRTEADEYLYAQGYPREVSMEDYGKYYVTPKRQTVKFKWDSKTAEQEYADAMRNYYEEVDKFNERHDINEIYAEIDRLAKEAEVNEKNCGGVADTFDGMMYGLGNTITALGGHSVDYYMRDSSTRIGEGVANIHEQVIRGDAAADRMYQELCPSVYGLIREALSYGT